MVNRKARICVLVPHHNTDLSSQKSEETFALFWLRKSKGQGPSLSVVHEVLVIVRRDIQWMNLGHITDKTKAI